MVSHITLSSLQRADMNTGFTISLSTLAPSKNKKNAHKVSYYWSTYQQNIRHDKFPVENMIESLKRPKYSSLSTQRRENLSKTIFFLIFSACQENYISNYSKFYSSGFQTIQNGGFEIDKHCKVSWKKVNN